MTVLLPHEVRPKPATRVATVGIDRPLALEIPAAVTTLADYHPRQTTLPNGFRLLTERKAGEGVVALELFVDAGQEREAKPGLAYLTGRLLEEGTLNRTADELAAEVEDAGGSLEVGPTGATLRVRAEDLERAVEWLADLAIRPSFPGESVAWLKRKIAAEYQSDRDDPAFQAEALFRSLVYGQHPTGRDPRGSARDVGRLTRDDVVAHHAGHFAPGNSFLVVVGDFEPKALERSVKRHFGAWSATRQPRRALPKLVRSARPEGPARAKGGRAGPPAASATLAWRGRTGTSTRWRSSTTSSAPARASPTGSAG